MEEFENDPQSPEIYYRIESHLLLKLMTEQFSRADAIEFIEKRASLEDYRPLQELGELESIEENIEERNEK